MRRCLIPFFQEKNDNKHMNVLYYITPKKEVEFLFDDFTIRQALEKMEFHRYSTIPVLSRETGKYLYSLREGDFLWFLKDRKLSFDDFSKHSVNGVRPSRDVRAVGASADLKELYGLIVGQNYVPVTDDEGIFIGIVTRQKVLDELLKKAR